MLRLATKLARPGLGLRFPAFRRPAWAGAVVARTLPAAAFLLILALWAGAHLTLGLHAIAEFDPPLGDGPYQLFNPLRRIDAGQRGGVDFQYFHGAAVPYVYYPAFAAWGKDIYASELARRLVTFALYVVGFLAVFGLATRRFAAALGLTAAAVVIGDQIGLADLMWPSNSIVGVRSFLPFLLIGVLLAGLRPSREAILCGAMAGAAVLLGTEHGVAAAVMLGLVWVGRR